MSADNGRRAPYIWHDMPDEVRREMERRRSSAKDPEETADAPPLAPAAKTDRAEKDANRKVKKAQQTAGSGEPPRNEEKPRRQKKQEKKEYPKEEEEPQQKEEEEPQHNEEEEKQEYPEEEEEPQQNVEEEQQEYPKEEEEPQQNVEEEQQEYPKEEEEPQQNVEEEKQEYPKEEEVEAQKQEENEAPQDADKRRGSQAVEVQQPQTVKSKKETKTNHTVRFRGSKWENVLKNHRSALEEDFKKDVTEATDMPEKRILGLEFKFEDVLVATFSVRHENDEEKVNEMQPKLRSYSFPHTTGLYKKEKDNQNPKNNEAPQNADQRRGSQSVEVQQPQTVKSKKEAKTNHTVRFRGSKWVNVLKNHRSALEKAFKKDVTEATGMPEKRILGLEFKFEDVLVATFFVRHENDEERVNGMHPKLRSYSFPHSTGLYKKEKDNQNSKKNEAPQDTEKGTGSQSVEVQQPQTVGSKKDGKMNQTVRFRGSKWENVLENDRNELETAFKKDVTEATDLSDDRISGLQFQYNEVLIVNFSVNLENNEERMNEFHPKLRDYNFPNTTALY